MVAIWLSVDLPRVRLDNGQVPLRHGDQCPVEITDLVERAVQCGLVDDLAGDLSDSQRGVDDGEAFEPVRPASVDVTNHADGVASHDFLLRDARSAPIPGSAGAKG